MPSKLLKLLFALALVTGVVACGDDSESADDSPAGVDVGTDESSNDAADTVDDPDDSDDRSEEHTSELQSLMRISYAVFCLKKKTANKQHNQQALYPQTPYSYLANKVDQIHTT